MVIDDVIVVVVDEALPAADALPLTVCSRVGASKTAAEVDAEAEIFFGVFGDLGLVGGIGDLTGAIGGFVSLESGAESAPKNGFSGVITEADAGSGVGNTFSVTDAPTDTADWS